MCQANSLFFARKIAKYGENVNIEKNAYFTLQLTIGDYSGMGIDCEAYGPVTIVDNVMMGPEVVIYTSGHKHDRIDIPMMEQGSSETQPVIIGNDVWIDRRAIIMPGVTIGDGVIIGAGTVVTQNIEPYMVAVGVPAKAIKIRLDKSGISYSFYITYIVIWQIYKHYSTSAVMGGYEMKIIQVMPFFGLGGAEIMCENLVYELKKMGNEVIVVSLYNKQTPITERFKKSGVDIRYLNKKDGFDISLFNKLRKLFLQEKPDVIHTHIYTTKYVFPIAAQLRIRVIHTVHSIATKEMSKTSRKLNQFFYKHFDVTPVALSEAVKKTIIEEYKLEPVAVPVILNGIDLEKCKPKIHYDIDNVFRIVHVGSFLEVKNHVGLISAFEIFNKKHPNSELHLIGDGERRKQIEQMISEKGLSTNVKFYGLQSNVHLYLHDMDVFTLPSLYEGVPMSIVEAMGTGLPIVATNVGGIPDMLDDESALLVPVDSNAIAEAFENYYKDKELRRQHGERAREHSAKFGAFMMANQYEHIYLMKIDKRK